MLNLDQMKETFEELYDRTHVPCCVLDASRTLLFPKSSPLMPYLDMMDGLFAQDEYPVHALSIYHYLVASFTSGDFTVLVGPCCLLEASIEDDPRLGVIKNYVSSETVESFCAMAKFVYTAVTHKRIEAAAIPVERIDEADILSEVEGTREANVESRRAEEATRDSYQFELKYLDYVKRGRKDKLDWIISQMGKTYRPKLGGNDLETMRYKFIALDTLLTRLAIQEGVPLDAAFSLSDALLQNLGRVRTAEGFLDYFRYMSFSFVDLITAASKASSPLVHRCVEYIAEHLQDKITLADLSEATGRSGAYISATFKRETGETLTTYILHRKVEEAEHLLLFTDMPAQDIATRLGFSSQSHFIAQFKKVTGQTPREYQTRNFYYL